MTGGPALARGSAELVDRLQKRLDVHFSFHRVGFAMLALNVGVKVWHLVLIVGWIGVCLWFVYDEYNNKLKDFWPSVGGGCAAFFCGSSINWGFWFNHSVHI